MGARKKKITKESFFCWIDNRPVGSSLFYFFLFFLVWYTYNIITFF